MLLVVHVTTVMELDFRCFCKVLLDLNDPLILQVKGSVHSLEISFLQSGVGWLRFRWVSAWAKGGVPRPLCNYLTG